MSDIEIRVTITVDFIIYIVHYKINAITYGMNNDVTFTNNKHSTLLIQ